MTKPIYKSELVDCVICKHEFRCEPDNPEDLCECPRCSIKKEYRWENIKIGQGHYHTQLRLCIQAAYGESIKNPNDVFLVEQFKPGRRRTLCRFQGGSEI